MGGVEAVRRGEAVREGGGEAVRDGEAARAGRGGQETRSAKELGGCPTCGANWPFFLCGTEAFGGMLRLLGGSGFYLLLGVFLKKEEVTMS
jgi:hypothetical protein